MSQPNEPVVPPSAGATAGFATSAGAGLAAVSGGLSSAQNAAAGGAVHLTSDAADALLAAIADISYRVSRLIADTNGIDQDLHLGQNWIGSIMNDRLRGAATGRQGAVAPVLVEFQQVLGQVEQTVRTAAGRYVATDLNAADAINAATGKGA